MATPTFVVSFTLPSSAAAGAALAWSTGVMVVFAFCIWGGGFFLLHCSLPLVRDCIALGRVDLSDMGRRAHTSIPTTAASDGHPGGVDLDFLFLEHHCSCIWQFWRDCERLPFWISTVNREVARVFAFGVSRSSGRVNQHLHMKTVQTRAFFLSSCSRACDVSKRSAQC